MRPELAQLRLNRMRLLPLEGKVPVLKDWQHRATDDIRQQTRWHLESRNYGIVCDRISVIDQDSGPKAEWWERNMPATPWKVKTPRGMHFVYGPSDLGNAQTERWDIRASGKGYVVGPGSRVRNRIYELLGEITLDLPAPDPDWWPKRIEPVRAPKIVIAGMDSERRITRAKAYGAFVKCVEGQRAHDTFYRFCCWMRDVPCCTRDEAETVIESWNYKNCVDRDGRPYPWSGKEIRHKLDSVFG